MADLTPAEEGGAAVAEPAPTEQLVTTALDELAALDDIDPNPQRYERMADVLLGLAARVRADERARVADEIARAIETHRGPPTGYRVHADIARQHATPPTTEETPDVDV